MESCRSRKVIADDMVDREFGTGCVKMTPAHDFNDFKAGPNVTVFLRTHLLRSWTWEYNFELHNQMKCVEGSFTVPLR